MFSATRIVAAVATLALGSSILLYSALPGPQDATSAAPNAAETPGLLEPAAFSGTRFTDGYTTFTGVEAWELPDGTMASGSFTQDDTVEADDPRIAGTMSSSTYWMGPGFSAEEPFKSGMFWGVMRIENADGYWEGTYSGGGLISDFKESAVLVGEGAYRGLFALVFIDKLGPMQGVILQGEPPVRQQP